MSSETHPNMDPLSLRGKRIGLNPNDKCRYVIDTFSYPATIDVFDKDVGDVIPKIGYMIIYQVKFNFENAGRKVVTYKISNFEAEGSQHHIEAKRRIVIGFLETHAETVLANNMYDTVLDWEKLTPNDPKAD